MPSGLVNALCSRQEFLDLVRFLREIADEGPERAIALKPPGVDAPLILPEYENRVDHAGMIAALFEKLRTRRGDLPPRLRQLPRHERPSGLVADLAQIRVGNI